MKHFFQIKGPLIGMAIFSMALPVKADAPYREVSVQGHRCLVAGPENLPDGAPVVFILHGLRANADDLFPLIGAMNLPPCPSLRCNGLPSRHIQFHLPSDRVEVAGSGVFLFSLRLVPVHGCHAEKNVFPGREGLQPLLHGVHFKMGAIIKPL